MERRKNPRQNCELPLTAKMSDHYVNRAEKTLNMSTNGGVCFRSSEPLQVGDRVEYEITVSSMPPPVKLLCSGRVLRCGPPKDALAGGKLDRDDNDPVQIRKDGFLRFRRRRSPALNGLPGSIGLLTSPYEWETRDPIHGCPAGKAGPQLNYGDERSRHTSPQ